MKLKQVAAAFSLVILSACSLVMERETKEVRGEITQYGIYVPLGDLSYEKNENIPSGRIRSSSHGVALIKRTTKIPLKLGTVFGYDFVLHGFGEKNLVELRCVVTHPPITKPDGTIITSFEYSREYFVNNGEVRDGGSYVMNHHYELVPGKWTRSYYYGNKLLVAKSFQVSSEYAL